jgi:hypothetical protein
MGDRTAAFLVTAPAISDTGYLSERARWVRLAMSIAIATG